LFNAPSHLLLTQLFEQDNIETKTHELSDIIKSVDRGNINTDPDLI